MGGLDSKTTAKIYNGLVAGKSRYNLATGIWTKDQAQVKLERALRKKLSQSGFHYRSASIERLYIPRSLGGRGLTSISHTYDQAMLALASYCQCATNELPRKILEAAWSLHQQHQVRGLVTRTLEVVESYPSLSMAAESGRLSMSIDGEVLVVEARSACEEQPDRA